MDLMRSRLVISLHLLLDKCFHTTSHFEMRPEPGRGSIDPVSMYMMINLCTPNRDTWIPSVFSALAMEYDLRPRR